MAVEVALNIPTTITTTTTNLSPSIVDEEAAAVVEEPHQQEDDRFSSHVLWQRLQAEATEALEDEPELNLLLKRTILAPGVSSFEEAIAMTVCYRLLQSPCHVKPSATATPNFDVSTPVFCPHSMYEIMRQALLNPHDKELDHTMSQAVRQDVLAVVDRDPACDTLLEVVLFMKGFAALVCHRTAHQKWSQAISRGKRRSLTSLFLQSQASAVFGVDVHPAANMGAGIFLDHGTGVVIGETARVGDGCTLLHGVTLGGTGKDHGDRHPKVGPRVLIGAGAKILGNIHIGAGAKIGAGSIVLKSIPAGATAVGAPAKIVGRALEPDPAGNPDEILDRVGWLHKSVSTNSVGNNSQKTMRTVTTVASSNGGEGGSGGSGGSSGGGGGTTTTTSSSSSGNPSSVTSESNIDESQKEDYTNGEDEEEDGEYDNGPIKEDKGNINSGGWPEPSDSKEGSATETVPSNDTIKHANGTLPSATAQQQRRNHHYHGYNHNNDDLSSMSPGCCCPFRDYTLMSSTAPPGTMTMVSLGEVLCPHGCTHDEVGSTLFELDTKNVGYVRWKNDNKDTNLHFKDRLATCLANNTELSSETIATVVEQLQGLYDQNKNNNKYRKKRSQTIG